MLKKKQDGLPAATVKAFAPPRAVPDLLEAFRQSLAAVQAETANDDGKPVKAARPKKSKAKVEGQREMLLPIAGGKDRGRGETGEVRRRGGRPDDECRRVVGRGWAGTVPKGSPLPFVKGLNLRSWM